MKTKDLIAILRTEDPTGELEVCVGNLDIHFVSKEPAYYDGRLQVLKRDPSKTGKCYDVSGADIRSDGHKVQIHALSIEDAIWETPDLPVTYDGEIKEDGQNVARWRAEAKS